MLATNLISDSKPGRVLPGLLLSTNNNRCFLDLDDVHSTTIVKRQETGDTELQLSNAASVPIGFGIFHKCTPNQIYCSMVSMSKEFEKGFVSVKVTEKAEEKAPKRHILAELKDVRPSLPNLSGLPQYFSAFAKPEGRPLLQHIVEEFVKAHVGTKQMELLRNFTVDLYTSDSGMEEHPLNLWRDYAGFIVADRFRFCEMEINSHSLLSALRDLAPSSPLLLQPLRPSNRALFHDYDQTVSRMDSREQYLDFLLDLIGVIGVIAIDERQQRPVGYALAFGGRVLQCYGEDEGVASSLLCALCRSMPSSIFSVWMFLRLDPADQPLLQSRLLPLASRLLPIRRLHSRSLPTTVKWAKVFAPAIGLHLF